MTVMHIDFRIPIVPNGSCYGSDFEVFEIFFKSIARVHHYIGYYLLNATHTHSTSSQRNPMSVLFVINHAKGSTNEIIRAHIHKIKKPKQTPTMHVHSSVSWQIIQKKLLYPFRQ